MNGAHLHLIVTHLPVLGVAFGALLLGFGLLRKHRVVQQVALGVLALAGIAAGVAYLTGEGAEEAIEGTLGSGKAFLERHEAAGVFGLVAAGIAGAMALRRGFLFTQFIEFPNLTNDLSLDRAFVLSTLAIL